MSEMSPAPDVDVDSVFELLANERRRRTLEHLFERPTPVSVPDVVDHLVTAELNGHDGPEDLEERIAMSLHHVHLPKLADSKVLDYDPERGEVTLRDAAAAVEPHLALSRDDVKSGLLERAD